MMDKIYEWLSWQMPRKFLYFCVMQAWAIATTEKYTELTPDEVSRTMVCKYLEQPEKRK